MTKSRKFIDLIKKCEIKTSRTIEHLSLCLGRDKRKISETIRNLIGIYAGTHGSVIIFCETKREANDLNFTLDLPQSKSALHGDVPQCNREVIFHDFKLGILKCLIATNVAARGLDIPSVDLIIQMSPPKKADEYVHRAGRTGRAGKNGVCVTFYQRSESYLMN
jgi:ATP-dependent RNA helicase DDX21